MRTAELVRTEIFGSVQGDQRAAAKALELFHAALLPQRRNHLIERGLQMRRMNRVEHRPDVIVRRNFRHAEQSMAIGGLASFFERALVGQERLRLHEKQRKRRQADVGHRIRGRRRPSACWERHRRPLSIHPKARAESAYKLESCFKPGGNPTIQRNLELLPNADRFHNDGKIPIKLADSRVKSFDSAMPGGVDGLVLAPAKIENCAACLAKHRTWVSELSWRHRQY